ncbi:MAG: LysR family transcriptional regulator [Bdellovibrionales bacterium]|nr:LysR family transcriptional regulator [Bdellovibrionales bacterium]
MEFELVHLFVKVVKTGGFSKAAEALRIPKSTVSKAVSRLESETGTKLLLRTTRSQTLTAAGKAFYDSCVGPIQAIEDAQRSLSGNDSLLTGTVKITAPEDLGTELLAPAIGGLTRKHPGLNFELLYTDQVLDLVKDGFDLAVRIGALKESSLQVKRLGFVHLHLVASPAYLKAQPKIQKPDDLRAQACLSLSHRSGHLQWNLKSKSGSTHVQVQPRIVSNQMSSLLRAAAADAGVALVPAFLCRPLVESGKLIRVLPHWTSQGLAVSLLSPLPFSSSARLRMSSDHLAAELQKALGSRSN